MVESSQLQILPSRQRWVIQDIDEEDRKMACFLVPAAEAIVTTGVTKVMEHRVQAQGECAEQNVPKVSLVSKMKWLNGMLAGGSALLAFEHVWHGEVVPYFPFLTAAYNAEDFADMLHEMQTVGVGMAALVTLVWMGMVAVTTAMERRAQAAEPVKVCASDAAKEN